MTNPISSAADKADVLIDTAKQTADSAIRSAQQVADEKLNQLADTVDSVRSPSPAINRIANDAEQLRQRSADALRNASFQVRESALRASDNTVAYIRDEPVKAVLIAAAVGAASMALLNAVSRAAGRD
jgi:ElaB/YqjD/DUF883 family membrane-anchored ribosome-binding protein